MASRSFRRLALLLPTALILSQTIPSTTAALELQASDYVSKILSSLAAGDFVTLESAANTLRRCGVDAITSSGGNLSLAQLDQIVADLKAGKNVSIPGGAGEDAFIVGSINQMSVVCEPNPELAKTDSLLSPPAGTTSA
jgi:hypothetical protein